VKVFWNEKVGKIARETNSVCMHGVCVYKSDPS